MIWLQTHSNTTVAVEFGAATAMAQPVRCSTNKDESITSTRTEEGSDGDQGEEVEKSCEWDSLP